MTIRIEVWDAQARADEALRHDAHALGAVGVKAIRTRTLLFLSAYPGEEALQRLVAALLADPVTERAAWWDLDRDVRPAPLPGTQVVEVAFRPGVTDVAAREAERGAAELGLPPLRVATGRRFEVEGEIDGAMLRRLARQLFSNETVQHWSLGSLPPHFAEATAPDATVERVALGGLSEAELVALSRVRLLSLDGAEMGAIRDHFVREGRDPTDVELETLAQTWSEHCVHKTFRSTIHFTTLDAAGTVVSEEQIDGLLRTYLRAATDAINPDWLRSAFVDNAGIIAFDDDFDLAFKVETHNHPSALEPFGGANTGVGGVVRDVIGVSARPIAVTDVLCFGPQDLPAEALPPGVLHPRRIAAGVVAGVADYGNKLGLPTVNGAILYDEGYIGNPLVYCGCVGLLPRGSHPRAAQPGDQVVALGGRTGRDGLHGATFSSAELTHETSELAGSAVQIGDPITEKGLIELIEAARDEGLYSAITDCGAGGFSSAVGEMGAELGVEVELAHVPLKYPGLRPWEIWLSEAQERMVLAVPPTHLPRLRALAAAWDVELCVLGHLTGDGWLRVHYEATPVANLPMDFLHNGLPQRTMEAVWQERDEFRVPSSEFRLDDTAPGDETVGNQGAPTENPPSNKPQAPNEEDGATPNASKIQNPKSKIQNLLLRMLADPNVASKEATIRQYDHEVRGGTLVRPLVGPALDGPSDAAMVKPLGTWGHRCAFVLSNGINPWYGQIDPYRMAISAIDEAIRNAVAVGADPDRIAILDNFCWGNPTFPDRLGALVRACQGCLDGALAYRTPFISGKDSLYNEWNGKPIPGTLLISAIAITPDMERRLTMPLKAAGNRLYLLGETRAELGGSLLGRHGGETGGEVPGLPAGALARYRLLHQAILGGWLAAAHDLSEGGLAVALAEMALAGRLGATVTLPEGLPPLMQLFSESNGRLLLEVPPEHSTALEAHFAGEPLVLLGAVTEEATVRVQASGATLIELAVADALRAWKGQENG